MGSMFGKYYTPQQPGSFLAASGFAKTNKINKQKFDKWALKQTAISLHKPRRKRFPRSKTIAPTHNFQGQADLIDMTNISKYNAYKYILVYIDVFSRFVYAIPLKDKTALSVTKAFQQIFSKEQPQMLQTDAGTEFKNSTMQTFLKSKNITHFHTWNFDTKATLAERFIQTIKTKIYRYFTAKNTYKWDDVLQKMIKSYNNSIHRTLKMTPNNARRPENNLVLWHRQYSKSIKKNNE